MTPEREARATELFARAIDEGMLHRPENELAAWLEQHCGSDVELREAVLQLIAGAKQETQSIRSISGTANAPDKLLGHQVGQYRIVSRLDSGGFGRVYVADDGHLGRMVAVKFIDRAELTTEMRALFDRERRILAQMKHPNIAVIHAAGELSTGEPYFVMEYVKDGKPLTSYCDVERMPIRERLNVFLEVCEAVAHAHRSGVFHRDLKPNNILVAAQNGERVAKVIDFGLAGAVQTNHHSMAGVTFAGSRAGTPLYMSPEQAAGEPLNAQTDVYSLGVILYELLCGSLPLAITPENLYELLKSDPRSAFDFLSKSDRVTLGARVRELRAATSKAPASSSAAGSPQPSERRNVTTVAAQRSTKPRKLHRSLAGDLEFITDKALARDQEQRYRDVSALAADIRRHLNHEPVSARPSSAWYTLTKFARRKPAVVGGVAATFMALAIGLAATLTFYGRAEFQRERAEEKTKLAEQRADETKQVADFQAAQLRDIDAQAMGVRLRRAVLAGARTAMRQGRLEEEEIQTRMAELEKLLAGSNWTDTALSTLDTNIFGRTLAAIDKQFGAQPLVQAQLLQTLADTLRELGLLESATDPQQRALEILRRVLGNEHLQTLTAICSMGALLQTQGKLVEAEPYYREALEKSRSVLGDEHRLTLNSINNMGCLLEAQGKRAEAEPYLRDALETKRRVLGDDDPDTLTSLKNMGSLYQGQGRLAEAEPYYREALEKSRGVLGDEHPDTVRSINGMGYLLEAQGKLAQAEPYSREALEKSRRVLGEEHPDTVRSICNMGGLLRAQGKLAEAEPYFREALEKMRPMLGDEHPDTLILINNMGSLLLDQGRLAEAEPYHREALEKRRRVLGDDHPDTLCSIHNMGVLLQARGRLVEAESNYREAMEKSRRVLGDEHPGTLISISYLGYLLQTQGRLAEAEPYTREALEKRRRVLGDEHPDTLVSITNIGYVLQAQDRLAESEPYYHEALAGFQKKLGAEHWLTANARMGLGIVLRKMSRFAEAEAHLLAAEPVLRTAQGVPLGRHGRCLQAIVDLYEQWHAAEPDHGYDTKAAEWRVKVEEWQATTQPAGASP